jgi:hypothetical protein
VNHPYLVLYGASAVAAAAAAAAEGGGSGSSSSSSAAAEAGVCGICREAAEDAVATGCRHVFCRLCLREYIAGLSGDAAAAGLLRDRTNDESAFIGLGDDDEDGGGGGGADEEAEDGLMLDDDDEDGGGAGRKRKRPSAAAAAAGAKGKGKGAGSGKKGGKKAAAASSSSSSSAAAAPAVAPSCPTCLAPLTVNLAAPSSLALVPAAGGGAGAGGSSSSTGVRRGSILSRLPADRVGAGFRSSTKIEALLEEIWRAQAEEPGAKFLVFSQVRSRGEGGSRVGAVAASGS